MKQMQGFRWKGQIVENRYYLEEQVSGDSGIREYGHLCGRFQGDKCYLEGQVRGISTGADEGNRCRGQVLPAGAGIRQMLPGGPDVGN